MSLPENFVRYGDFKILNGRGMRATGPIYLIFKRNRDIITSLYNILQSFFKIGQEFFEIIWVQTDSQTDTQTDRHTYRQTNTRR